eukprot:892696-Pelagomonas_calceolata.AAC.5
MLRAAFGMICSHNLASAPNRNKQSIHLLMQTSHQPQWDREVCMEGWVEACALKADKCKRMAGNRALEGSIQDWSVGFSMERSIQHC